MGKQGHHPAQEKCCYYIHQHVNQINTLRCMKLQGASQEKTLDVQTETLMVKKIYILWRLYFSKGLNCRWNWSKVWCCGLRAPLISTGVTFLTRPSFGFATRQPHTWPLLTHPNSPRLLKQWGGAWKVCLKASRLFYNAWETLPRPHVCARLFVCTHRVSIGAALSLSIEAENVKSSAGDACTPLHCLFPLWALSKQIVFIPPAPILSPLLWLALWITPRPFLKRMQRRAHFCFAAVSFHTRLASSLCIIYAHSHQPATMHETCMRGEKIGVWNSSCLPRVDKSLSCPAFLIWRSSKVNAILINNKIQSTQKLELAQTECIQLRKIIFLRVVW